MVWKAETHKRLESVIEVVNDCLDMLCKAETRYNVFGDSLMLGNTLMMQFVYTIEV